MAKKKGKPRPVFTKREVMVTEEMVEAALIVADGLADETTMRFLTECEDAGLEVTFSSYNNRKQCSLIDRATGDQTRTYAVAGYGNTYCDAFLIVYQKVRVGLDWMVRPGEFDEEEPRQRFG